MSHYGEFWLCGLGILVSLFLRCCTSLHPYSGEGTPPMFGDYEAQRHWMEITVNLPPTEWYRNSTKNDLMYWGLDYPPLTAYHSWICGKIARLIDPKYVELGTSRGFESPNHKLFMRYTVLIVDILIFIPAICAYFFVLNNVCENSTNNGRKKGKLNQKIEGKKLSYSVCIVLSLLYPGIILIDYGHFQYNCVSLGLTILAVTFITCGRHLWASFFFTLALNYKQMELYHALPFFLYLLSSCVPKPGGSIKNSIGELTKIGLTVMITFAISWLPFIWDYESITDVLTRLFPLARGVFEDKVSNIWCAVNIFYKLKHLFTNMEMARLCMLSTLVAILPSSIDLFLRPSIKKFVPALINSSLAFFLFSFQVHEKSILLVAIPVMMYFPQKPIMCFWFLIISTFSMLPLLIKDNLIIAFIALNIFYIAAFRVAVDYTYKIKEKNTTSNSYVKDILITLLNAQDGTGSSLQVVNITFEHLLKNRRLIKLVLLYVAFYFSLFGCTILFFVSTMMDPPERYPDLFPLLISVYSCCHFLIFFIYFNVCQFKIKQDYSDNFKFKQE